MTTELTNALYSIIIVTVTCLVLSPILVWILPDQNRTIEEM